MFDTERGLIVATVFDQGDKSFTASNIADEAGVAPNKVYDVVGLMDCVKETGRIQGELGMVRSYEVTGKSPEACRECYFNSGRTGSCSRAPNRRRSGDAGPSSPWQNLLNWSEEARTGRLTDASGNPIPPIGHL